MTKYIGKSATRADVIRGQPRPPQSVRMVRSVALSPEQQEKRQTWWRKVKTFLEAVTGPARDDAEYERVRAICLTGKCGKLKTEGDKHYCGACGCGKWKLAELDTKLRFAAVTCPLELF